MQEFKFEEARQLLEEGKCTKIRFYSWAYNDEFNYLYLHEGKLCWEDNEEYDLVDWKDWKLFPWHCLDLDGEIQ